MPIETGYVYLLKSPTAFWKIGKTKNPDDRRKTFSVKLPFEVQYAHLIYCHDMHKLEKEMHIIFKKKRVDGEWFSLNEDDVRWIKQFNTQIDFDKEMVNSTHAESYTFKGRDTFNIGALLYFIFAFGAMLVGVAATQGQWAYLNTLTIVCGGHIALTGVLRLFKWMGTQR